MVDDKYMYNLMIRLPKQPKKVCRTLRCCQKLTWTLAVEIKEIDMSTETFIGRPSTWTTAPPTSSTRFAIAPEANFPLLSCNYVSQKKCIFNCSQSQGKKNQIEKQNLQPSQWKLRPKKGIYTTIKCAISLWKQIFRVSAILAAFVSSYRSCHKAPIIQSKNPKHKLLIKKFPNM